MIVISVRAGRVTDRAATALDPAECRNEVTVGDASPVPVTTTA